MLTYLFTKRQISQLVAIWSREDSRLGELVDEKVQVYKQLRWLWDDPTMQAAAGRSRDPDVPGMKQSNTGSDAWNQTNTVLIDDFLEKADSEPYNLVQVEEFTGKAGDTQDDVLGVVLAYIEDLAWERDVSSAIHHKPFGCARRQTWNWKIGCPDFDNEQERSAARRYTQQESVRGQHAKSIKVA